MHNSFMKKKRKGRAAKRRGPGKETVTSWDKGGVSLPKRVEKEGRKGTGDKTTLLEGIKSNLCCQMPKIPREKRRLWGGKWG